MGFPILSSCPNFDGFVRTPKALFLHHQNIDLARCSFSRRSFYECIKDWDAGRRKKISLLLAEMIDNRSATLL